MNLTDPEWSIMDVLWSGTAFSLGEITRQLSPVKNWSKKTVFTYLQRMESKGLVCIDRSLPSPYQAAVSREECASRERKKLLHKVYDGAAGDLIAAFLKENPLPKGEIERLKKMLEEMEE